MARGAFSLALVVGLAASAAACPFCTAVKPSLSQRIEESVQAALVEVASDSAKGESAKSGSAKGESADEVRFTVRQPLGGAEPLIAGRELVIATRDISGVASRASWRYSWQREMGRRKSSPGKWCRWTRSALPTSPGRRHAGCRPLSGSLISRNSSRTPTRRLPRMLISSSARRRTTTWRRSRSACRWPACGALDRGPAGSRIAEGFLRSGPGPGENGRRGRANRDVLARLVNAPADDFRAGFDGVLGGYLMLAGTTGLAHVERRLFANPQARAGDVRHAATALRFVHEFACGGHSARRHRAPRGDCWRGPSWPRRRSSTWRGGKIGNRSRRWRRCSTRKRLPTQPRVVRSWDIFLSALAPPRPRH